MKRLYTHRLLLRLVAAAIVCLPLSYADDAKDDAPAGKEESALPEEGSKEWKQKRNFAIQKHSGQEFKDFKAVVNLYKKAKNDRDIKRLNKMMQDTIKKYSPLYDDGKPVVINGFPITVDDLEKAHIKLGSQRRKMYKDILETARRKSNSSAMGTPAGDDAGPSINEADINKIKGYIRIHQEDYADKEDAKCRDMNSKF